MPDHFKSLIPCLATAAGGPLLLFDTAHGSASAALITSSEIVEQAFGHKSRPSDGLVDVLALLLERANVSRKALRALVVGAGPGSFTGVRVALATAKGLCAGLGCPLLGASSLYLLALNAGPGLTLVGWPVRQGEFVAALIRVSAQGEVTELLEEGVYGQAKLSEHVLQKMGSEAGPLTVLGEALGFIKDVVGNLSVAPLGAPRASLLALLVQERLRAQSFDAAHLLMPRYLSVSTPERLLIARQKEKLESKN